MKNLKLLGLLMSISVSMAIKAETTNLAPNVLGEIVSSLDSQRLLVDQKDIQNLIEHIEGFANTGLPMAPSSEGLPSSDEISEIDPQQHIRDAYSSVELISKALEDRKTYALGPALRFLEDEMKTIVAVSGTKQDERLLRFTLNRALDVSRHVLPVAGKNSELIAQQTANFYKESLELAAGFTNNNINIVASYTQNDGSDIDAKVSQDVRKLNWSSAEFGRVYANFLFRYSTGVSSNASKAVLLMRLTGFLAVDLGTDLKVREAGISQSLADIISLQNSVAYKNILKSLKEAQEPSPQDVATLRRSVYQLLSKLPDRLSKAGVYKTLGQMPNKFTN